MCIRDRYNYSNSNEKVLSSVNQKFEIGNFYAIIGKSGAGKSTLQMCIRDRYKTSGHWDHYKENMFPMMKVDDEEFVLRPMNCPHHMLCLLYTSRCV